MGCGQIALLGQFVKKRAPAVNVTCTELDKDICDCAKINIESSRLNISLANSDLYTQINCKFDLISFNPPYVPDDGSKIAKIKSHTETYRKFPSARYGGIDGLETAEKFLAETKEYLNDNGIVLLGVNCYYVAEKSCTDLIGNQAYTIIRIHRMALNDAVVFELKCKKKKSN